MTPDQSLDAIKAAWIEWATMKIGEKEFAARVAEALEASGRELIGKVEVVANDD